jgi:hypothetical protein
MTIPMEISDLNIDLLVEKNEDGVFTRVLDSPIGTAAAFFHMPFSHNEVESFTRLVSAPYRPDAGRLDALRDTAKEIGTRLFDALFAGAVGPTFFRSMNYAYQQRTRLRLRLRISEAPELLRLPWEYLYNAQRDEFIVLSGHTPFCRYVDLMHQVRPLRVTGPMRTLVIISSPEGYPPVDANREWLSFLDTIDVLGVDGRLIVERMVRPTLFELQRRLRSQSYHIIHYVGHTTFDAISQYGAIVLEDEQRRGRPVNGSHLGSVLADHFSLRLAVFHSCSTWQVTPQEPFTNIAYSLVRRGLPAAVVTPFEMTDRATLAFGFDFYSRIAAGEPVDVALASSRRAMLSDIAGVEWGGPMLIMRVADGCLFDLTPDAGDKRRSAAVVAGSRHPTSPMSSTQRVQR